MNYTVTQIKRVYFVILALNWLSVGLPLPIFVLFMQSRGINLLQLGVIMGLYSATIVLLELPTGGLADAAGRKKVAMLAYAINVLAGAALFFSFSFWGFLLGMILMGAGRALNSGALDAWYVDSLQAAEPAVDLQPALAQAGTITLLALGAGTLAGGALPTVFAGLAGGDSALITPYSVTLLVSLVLKLLLLLIVARAVAEPPRMVEAGATWRAGFEAVPTIVGEAFSLTRHNRNLPLLMGAAMVGGLTLSAVETFWQPHFAGLLGGSIAQSWIFGLVMTISFLAGVGGNLLSIPAGKRLNHRYALLAALARGMQTIALLAMALMQQLFGFAAGFWIYYLGNGINNSPHDTLVNQEIPAERRSTMLSIQSLASYIGGFLGSIFLGAVAEGSTVSTAWIVAAAVSMVSLLLYARVRIEPARAGQSHEQSIAVQDGR